MPDSLTDRLVDAAADAIRNERPELERDPDRLRGVVLDLQINSAGVVVDGTCFVERRTKGSRR